VPVTYSFVPKLTRTTILGLKWVFSVIFLISICANTYLFFHYEHTRPSAPDPLVGRIYSEHQIGVNFYLTSNERNLLRCLTAVGFVSFFLGAACYHLEKRSSLPVKK